MKNIINYFYNINIDNIRMIDENYYFVYHGNNFVFQYIKEKNLDYEALYLLNQILLNNNKPFYQIISNKYGQIFTINNNKTYILMLQNIMIDKEFDFLDLLDTNIAIKYNNNILNRLNKFKWVDLWTKKIDYFEIFINHNINHYNFINRYVNYFIGLGENAIKYANNTLKKITPSMSDRLVVSHNRLNNTSLKELYNPLYLVIDHPVRDASDYLKLIFFNNSYLKVNIDNFLNELNLSNYGANLLIARMLFPSFFFDRFEMFYENKIKVEDCLKLVDKMNEYEEYLYYIYKLLKKNHDLFEIEWLKKIDYSSTFTTPNTSGTSFTNIISIPSFNVTSIMLQ